MTLEQQKKFANHIMRLLKVRSVSFPVGVTDKGPLSIKFYEHGDYEMILDAVPLTTADSLTDENNIELKAVLEKYYFGQEEWRKDVINVRAVEHIAPGTLVQEAPKKKLGRPKKSK
jgi:hypothetical protein